jgi:Asp-tRNA(Asn)/Glu-tRNA(Gln) amidotransferase B subunit
MNTKTKQRRVININKEDFDIIKKYCDDNALDMSKWIVKNILEKINKENKKLQGEK